MRKLVQRSHPFYHAPVFRIDAVEDIVQSDDVVIYQLSIGDGMLLSMLVRANISIDPFLRVTFHGARTASTSLPYFLRVNTSRQASSPFVLFSDPTLGLDTGNLLSWYVGTPLVNVDDEMERIVRHIVGLTRSESVVFEGSSGGGFVTLRMSARFARSVGVVFSPQTDIFRYHPRFAFRIRELLYNLDQEFVLKRDFPGRFNVADIYASGGDRGNLIEYAQNTSDHFHMEEHLKPFLGQLGLEGGAESGLDSRLRVVRDALGEGHFPHPGERWDEIVSSGMRRLLASISDATSKPAYLEEPYNNDDIRVDRMRHYCVSRHQAPTRLAEWGATNSSKVPLQVIEASGNDADLLIGHGSERIEARIIERSPEGRYIRIFLHGPINPEQTPLPHFDDRLAGNDESVILDVFISDPTLRLKQGLRVGWYLGTEEWDPLPVINRFIQELLDSQNADFAVFIGASSGGFAALKLAELSQYNFAVTFCPELSVQEAGGSFAEALREVAFPNYSSLGEVSRSRAGGILTQAVPRRIKCFVNPTADHYIRHLNASFRGTDIDASTMNWVSNMCEAEETFQTGQTAPQTVEAQKLISSAVEEWLLGVANESA